MAKVRIGNNLSIGEQFGDWSIISSPILGRKTKYTCKCICGKIRHVEYTKLVTKRSQGCGCSSKKYLEARTKHNLSKTRLYNIWCKMKSRCYCETVEVFHHYGGRQITVCNQWKNDFKCFYDWAICNGYSDNLSIDRIDVNGNYSPENCRWVTQKEQMGNTRRSVREYSDTGLCLKHECEKRNVKVYSVRNRIKRGVPAELIFVNHVKRPVICKETKEIFESCKKVVEKYGGCQSQLSQVLKGKRRTFAGLSWEYHLN